MTRAKYEKEKEGRSEIATPKKKRIKSDFAKRSLRPTEYKVSSTERRCFVDLQTGESAWIRKIEEEGGHCRRKVSDFFRRRGSSNLNFDSIYGSRNYKDDKTGFQYVDQW